MHLIGEETFRNAATVYDYTNNVLLTCRPAKAKLKHLPYWHKKKTQKKIILGVSEGYQSCKDTFMWPSVNEAYILNLISIWSLKLGLVVTTVPFLSSIGIESLSRRNIPQACLLHLNVFILLEISWPCVTNIICWIKSHRDICIKFCLSSLGAS